jgi:hypothetical protein
MYKAFWRAIKANGFAVPEGHTPAELLPELLAGLGSVDPELRDHLCLEILGEWLDAGRFTESELHQITVQMLANLEQGVGQGENDLVFLRTFSVLILANLLYCDTKGKFLTEAEFRQIKAAAIRYFAAEQDLRGFVPEKGWAHSVAHTADLLAWLANSPRSSAVDLEDLLDAICLKLLTPTPYAWHDREEFRLGRAVIAILKRNLLPAAVLTARVERLAGSQALREAFSAGQDNERHNVLTFLGALHLLVTYQPDVDEFTRAALLTALHGALQTYVSYLR